MQVYTFSNRGTDITAGKYYDYHPVRENDNDIGWITDDAGFDIVIKLDECAHLDGDSWVLVEDVQ